MKRDHRAYSICEPEIHDALGWDMDLIVACMEVIRLKLPYLLQIENGHLQFDLVSLENPHGPPYPVIGVYSPIEDDKSVPDFLELSKIATDWVDTIGLESLKKQASELKTVSWHQLEKAGFIQSLD